jgi:hypothetical protein
MAEIALPILGLGALYLISNKDNNKKENYENIGKNINKLPNTDSPDINYPLSQRGVQSKSIDVNNKNHIKQYLNPNQTTDKFFNENIYLETANQGSASGVGDNIPNGVYNNQVYSLTGEPINQSNFKHNNMVPFFGSKIKGASNDSNVNESILDNMQGSGSQWPKKVEQAPLFKPQENIQWAHGMPNESDFMQSRQMPSTKIANVLPWEQEKVAPGLGLGYTTEGSGGFNSGTLHRNEWLDRNVDELRTVTNPKVTYTLEGHQGPAQGGGTTGRQKEVGHIGNVEKNRPDTDYVLGPERWFTTTGATSGHTLAPEQILHDNNRPTTSSEHYGVASHGDASYLKGEYTESIRQQLPQHQMNTANAVGRGPANENDFGINGFKLTPNNRDITCKANKSENMGMINGAVKAMFAPVLDILKPSRKENFIGNPNPNGNPASLVPSLPITNPNDKPKTTVKETTQSKLGLDHLNISSVGIPDGGYLSANHDIRNQQRNTTNCENIGIAGPISGSDFSSVEAYYNQRNNVNKTIEGRPNPGGTSMFTSNHNIKIEKKDSDRRNYQNNNDIIIPASRQVISHSMPSAENYGKISMPQINNQNINNERMQPDILKAFKNNPYAKSLNSY